MTLDDARLLANVQARARRLFEDGYRAQRLDAYMVEVTSGDGTPYEVDTLFETCSCPFYTKWRGQYPCKHLLGYGRLLAHQAEQGERQPVP
jgi:predicted nucleic acid-binding Zn finger protein